MFWCMGQPMRSALVRSRPTSVSPVRRRVAHQESAEDLAAELSGLPGLSRDALCERFRRTLRDHARIPLSRKLLVYAIAYGSRSSATEDWIATRRLLDRAAQDLARGREPSAVASLQPGTRLLREWQGVVHEVIVHEQSVEYRGKSWSSLSAVAREITGTRWSGPRFFGLHGKERDGR